MRSVVASCQLKTIHLFRSHTRLPSPQLFELLEKQEREGGVVAQTQEIRREAFPVSEYALVAANFNKRVEQSPAKVQ
jgi:hypothetical protein